MTGLGRSAKVRSYSLDQLATCILERRLSCGGSVMASFSLVLGVLVSLALSSVHAQKGPGYKTCKRKQPPAQLNECVREAWTDAIPKVSPGGLPKFRLLPLDPLHIDRIYIPEGKGSVRTNVTFTNIDVVGVSKGQAYNVEMDVDKMKLKMDLKIKGNLYVLGDYEVDGKVLVIPMKGKGRCNITLVNPTISVHEVQAEPVMKKGKQYAKGVKFNVTLSHVDRAYYRLENLFDGNKELGDNMNVVLNDNWKVLYDDLVEPIFGGILPAFVHFLQTFLDNVPYDAIFPN